MTEYLQVWRANVAEGSVERLLELRPAAIAEAQALCPELLGADLVRLEDGTWLDVLRWSCPDGEPVGRPPAALPRTAHRQVMARESMADFKDEISVKLAGRLARELTTAWPAFPRRRFTRGLGDALAPLALMARVELLTDRLVNALPDDFDTAAKVLWATLDSPSFSGVRTRTRSRRCRSRSAPHGSAPVARDTNRQARTGSPPRR